MYSVHYRLVRRAGAALYCKSDGGYASSDFILYSMIFMHICDDRGLSLPPFDCLNVCTSDVRKICLITQSFHLILLLLFKKCLISL